MESDTLYITSVIFFLSFLNARGTPASPLKGGPLQLGCQRTEAPPLLKQNTLGRTLLGGRTATHAAKTVINELRAEQTKLACPEAGRLRSGSFACELATRAAPVRRAERPAGPGALPRRDGLLIEQLCFPARFTPPVGAGSITERYPRPGNKETLCPPGELTPCPRNIA